MRHKGCGGDVGEDWGRVYVYVGLDGWVEQHPAIVCKKCNKELGCDEEIELEGEEDMEFYEGNNDVARES